MNKNYKNEVENNLNLNKNNKDKETTNININNNSDTSSINLISYIDNKDIKIKINDQNQLKTNLNNLNQNNIQKIYSENASQEINIKTKTSENRESKNILKN